MRDASEGVGALASGSVRLVNPLTRLARYVSAWSVRTDMAKTLLLEGAPAQAKLQSLNELVNTLISKNRSMRCALVQHLANSQGAINNVLFTFTTFKTSLFVNATNKPLVGGKLYTYLAGDYYTSDNIFKRHRHTKHKPDYFRCEWRV